MYRNYYTGKRACCSNNKCNNNEEDMMDNSCVYFQNIEDVNISCECGFDEEENIFPKDPMLAQSYVPWKYMDKTFVPNVGLKMGTIFPELVSPYMPGQSLEFINYIKRTNNIGEGCNK